MAKKLEKILLVECPLKVQDTHMCFTIFLGLDKYSSQRLLISGRSGPTAEVKHERVKIRYYQNKLAEQIKLSCSDELRQLKETTKHCREQSVLDRKNQHLQQAHRILYVDHFRES